MGLGAHLSRHLGLHHKVGQQLRHRPQRILGAARRFDELACQLVSLYPVFGHPLVSSFCESRDTSTGASSGWPVKTLIYTVDFARPQEAGGIYLFDSQASLDAYLNGPLVAQIRGLTSIRNISMKQFEVMPEVTALTRGPFEAALTSDA